MNIFALWIFIFLAIILLLSFPLPFKVFVYSNLIDNANFVCVKLLNIFYICKKINFQNKKIIITSANGKQSQVKIKFMGKFGNNFIFSLAKEIKIDFFKIAGEVGTEDNALSSAYLSGAVQIALSELKVFISSKKNVIISYNIGTNYHKDKLTLAFSVFFSISLGGVLLSLLMAIFKSLGDKNGKKRKSNSWNSG